MNQQNYTFIIVAAVILFSIFRRVCRNIGWQQLNPGKMLFRVVIFLILGLVFLVGGAIHPVGLISEVVGILAGVLLAYYGAAMTGFEQRDGRWYYRPNTWIGSIVSAIFFSRLLYRMYEMYTLTKSGGLSGGYPQDGGWQSTGIYAGEPWTAGLLVIMFAYYSVYYIILLRKQKKLSLPGNN